LFTKKTIRDIDLKGKTVLLRADYNVPVEKGKITSDFRIQQSLPTVEYLLEQKCRVIICSHLGRPKGPHDLDCSLKPVAKRLGELLKKDVAFADDCVGAAATEAVKMLKPGHVLLLENVRFHPQEEENDTAFAKKLADLADVFVQDGFGVVHRAHASTEAVTHFLPSVSGLLLEKEVDTLTNVMAKPKRPLMAIIGGAKISDKMEILNKLIDLADFVAIGGAMANTFLLAKGVEIGKSLADKEDLSLARDIMDRAAKKAKEGQFVFYLPQDGVVAHKIDKAAKTRIVDWGAHVIADIENYPKRPPHEASAIKSDEMILDVGPFSGAFIAGGIQLVNTVIWNGALGVTEVEALHDPVGPFAHGTDLIMDSLVGQFGHKPFSVIGGGDTTGYLESRKMTDYFDHVSTGGGASLELMSGKKLPGVEALQNK
jgi:phosphoglycerate kinase